jgi:hypothetical protein
MIPLVPNELRPNAGEPTFPLAKVSGPPVTDFALLSYPLRLAVLKPKQCSARKDYLGPA